MTDTKPFQALMLEESDGAVSAAVTQLTDSDLPDGDVLVRTEYSTLNYKDGMVLKGLGRLVRNYPHVPGIDLAGVVEASDSPDYASGDRVVLNGWRVGEAHWGGYAGKARVKSDWLVPLPDAISTRQAMAIGTAGYTAMLAVLALEDHGLTPANEGEVLITGAAGGVGSVAVAILVKLGYRVAASTGRAETHDYLTGLGASSIIARAELEEPPKGPLGSERWSGAIDAVGGVILANLLASLKTGAACAAVGLAASPKLETTVVPFLLRGVSLLGIDSVMCPKQRRVQAWARLAEDLPADKLEAMVSEVPLGEVAGHADAILAGQVRGRLVIRV
ncbi:MAG: MDR family oxidoreductase [Rhodospirillales bacterium]|nr:oxidoreductase [Rhodospirillaceae bacterium]MDP6430300.1 MDR family oxidoreductase [Rhodospirillales bacterium]MDP6646380.1 MDR family oxidoreductase [Rhodospirillales bacterium]MDP6843033.1 MDR family oxidoreductase [Rhodospirillales bacterium]